MNFEHYVRAMKEVRTSKVLEDKMKDPEFLKFYNADAGKKNELILFDEWKPLAIEIDANATDAELKEIFNKGKADVHTKEAQVKFDIADIK